MAWIAQVSWEQLITGNTGALLVAGAALALYIAARVIVWTITTTARPTPFWFALGHWIPICFVALAATIEAREEIAVGVTFATAVAALSLNLGVVITSAGGLSRVPPSARMWPFVLPAAMLALIAGFSGQLTPWHALFLLVQGVLVTVVWPRVPLAKLTQSAPPPPPITRLAELFLGLLLAAVGAWGAIHGTERLADETYIMTTGLIAAAIIGPLLVLPMVNTGTYLAQRGLASLATESFVILALMNLCLLLPMIVGSAYLRRVWVVYASTAPVQMTFERNLEPIYYPMAVWRVDTVLLIILSLLLLPVGLGRWDLGRREGILLIIGYGAYLVMTAMLGTR